VPKVEGTQTHYVLFENGLLFAGARALTKRERDVLQFAARGLPSKLIAYGLGIAESTVSTHLESATAKLGLLSRIELVRLAALLTQDERATLDDDALTQAESEVLELLRRGLSNRQIAAARMRSVRTIANQVASLLKKMNEPSRRSLIVRR
jgi:DNA-binding NarL/FixJ family response regulator